MQTKQIRTTHSMSYTTAGNLALVPEEAPVFTVIEGGASERAVRRSAQYASRRAERPEVDAGVRVRCFIAFVLVLVTLIGASLITDVVIAQACERSFESVGTESVMVREGDSLWQIAEAHPVEGRSVTDVVQWIQHTNGLNNATLFVGQVLIVPMS